MAITSVEMMIERMKDPLFHHHILADQIIALRAMFVYAENYPNDPIPAGLYYQAGLQTPAENTYRVKQTLTPKIKHKRRKVVTPVIGGITDVQITQGYQCIKDKDRENQARLVIKRSLSQIGILPDDDDDTVRDKVLDFFRTREEITSAWDKALKEGELVPITKNKKPSVSNQDSTIGALVTLIKRIGWFM